jgi:uncharacterized protein (TIGR00255 family)
LPIDPAAPRPEFFQMNSMTGFGRGTAVTNGWQATLEMSSVNRKQAEIVIQAPRELLELETRVRHLTLGHISRGRVQISIHLEPTTAPAAVMQIDSLLAQAFAAACLQLGKTVGQDLTPSVADFLHQPGILSTQAATLDPETAWTVVQPALAAALVQLTAMRRSEGTHLKTDFIKRLATLTAHTAKIAESAPQRLPRQRDLLAKRLRDSGLNLDPSDERVAKELALFADRCDISEELIRLDSHFAKFHDYLAAKDSAGRAMDFLCQEISRELNTIGSKANDAAIAQTIVEAKAELEKIREQVQNIE